MKHLLKAALIATALASPVSGEGIYIECINSADPNQKDGWTLYPDLMRFTFGRDPLEHSSEILVWNDRVVGWAAAQENLWFVLTYVLNLETMQMMEAYVEDYRVVETLYRCTRPL